MKRLVLLGFIAFALVFALAYGAARHGVASANHSTCSATGYTPYWGAGNDSVWGYGSGTCSAASGGKYARTCIFQDIPQFFDPERGCGTETYFPPGTVQLTASVNITCNWSNNRNLYSIFTIRSQDGSVSDQSPRRYFDC